MSLLALSGHADGAAQCLLSVGKRDMERTCDLPLAARSCRSSGGLGLNFPLREPRDQ
jgi:hypothetical protein